jgi:hypothetical protein
MFWGSSAAATRLMPPLTADIVRLRRTSGLLPRGPAPCTSSPRAAQGRPDRCRLCGHGASVSHWCVPAPGLDRRAHHAARSDCLPGGEVDRRCVGHRAGDERDACHSRTAAAPPERRSRGRRARPFHRDGERRLLRSSLGRRRVIRRPRPALVFASRPLVGGREPGLGDAPDHESPRCATLARVTGASREHPRSKLAGRRLLRRAHGVGARRLRRGVGDDRHLRLRRAELTR